MRTASCLTLVLFLGAVPTGAQTFLDDQVELVEAGLSKSVFWFAGAGNSQCAGDLPPAGSAICEPMWTMDPAIGSGEQRNARWGAATDAMGNVYHLIRTFEGVGAEATHVYEVERLAGGTQTNVVARTKNLVFTCFASGSPCLPQCGGADIKQLTDVLGMRMDGINGTIDLLVHARLGCQTTDDLGEEWGIVRVSGLPTLLDIILSYQPPSTLSFNVPVRPEGLPGADSFSVYAGDVLTASDLSQAAPLDCTVPAGRPPVPGEHLTVPDNLPDPPPGESRYYLAAVSYQGQRRAGRSSVNGTLQGRNAAALAGCP